MTKKYKGRYRGSDFVLCKYDNKRKHHSIYEGFYSIQAAMQKALEYIKKGEKPEELYIKSFDDEGYLAGWYNVTDIIKEEGLNLA